MDVCACKGMHASLVALTCMMHARAYAHVHASVRESKMAAPIWWQRADRQTSKEVRHADASLRLQLGLNLRKLRNVMFKVIFIRSARNEHRMVLAYFDLHQAETQLDVDEV